MNYSAWKLPAARALIAGASLTAFISQAQAAVAQPALAMPISYVPGSAAVEAGSYGGGALLVWGSVLLLTLACLAALAFLIREPRSPVAVALAASPAVEVRPVARRQFVPVSLSRPVRRLPKRRATKTTRLLPALRPAFSAKASWLP
ncbi:MAG TPA: hypothetical protein VLI06_04965 [Solimonas sp.]|nr:hypothetical protein [Solimonas sp.]